MRAYVGLLSRFAFRGPLVYFLKSPVEAPLVYVLDVASYLGPYTTLVILAVGYPYSHPPPLVLLQLVPNGLGIRVRCW